MVSGWRRCRLPRQPGAGRPHPSKVLIDLSSSAGMLVVGSRAHGGFVGLLIGSVSAHCAEHAVCPVVVVHEGSVREPDGPSAG